MYIKGKTQLPHPPRWGKDGEAVLLAKKGKGRRFLHLEGKKKRRSDFQALGPKRIGLSLHGKKKPYKGRQQIAAALLRKDALIHRGRAVGCREKKYPAEFGNSARGRRKSSTIGRDGAKTTTCRGRKK